MPLPALAIPVAAAVLRAGVGLITGKKKADRRRSAIYDAYTRGKGRLDLRQHDLRESTIGSLADRGLTGGGTVTDVGAVQPTPVDYGTKKQTPIALAMLRAWAGRPQRPTENKMDLLRADAASRPAPQPHTLGEQQLSDLRSEQLLEQNDLLAARDNGIDDAGAEATQGAIDSIASGIQTGMNVYGAGKELQASRAGAAPTSTPASPTTPIQDAMRITNPANWFGGIVGTDPLGTAGSSWATPDAGQPGGAVPLGGARNRTIIGDGQPNFDFRRD